MNNDLRFDPDDESQARRRGLSMPASVTGTVLLTIKRAAASSEETGVERRTPTFGSCSRQKPNGEGQSSNIKEYPGTVNGAAAVLSLCSPS